MISILAEKEVKSMPSWDLHKHWAEKLGINRRISEGVDKAIDDEGADVRGERLVEKLSEIGLLKEEVREETFRAVALHNIMDCLRDLIWELGSKPVRLIPPEKMLKIAYGMCIDRGYVFVGGRPGLGDFEEVINTLKALSRELIYDIVNELSPKGLREIGYCHRINKKYIRQVMEEVPELRKYREHWEYSKL